MTRWAAKVLPILLDQSGAFYGYTQEGQGHARGSVFAFEP
jgi:hypothetical protein